MATFCQNLCASPQDNHQQSLESMRQERDVAQAKADRLQEDLHEIREKLKSSRQEMQVLQQLIYLCGSALTNAWILGTKMVEDVGYRTSSLHQVRRQWISTNHTNNRNPGRISSYSVNEFLTFF
jgi:hypothetical protein